MEMDMETEETQSFKRLSIKNTIQTNFGDDFVFQIASTKEIPSLAVSLSSNAIKFYSPETGQYFGECKGHSGTINQISFSSLLSPSSSPHILRSCSSDGTVRFWDTRTFKQVSLLRTGSSQEIFSFSIGGSAGNLLAAGCNSQILFWDWRTGKQVSCLEDSHVEDVTQVMNVGTSIAKVGFFGELNQKLWCLTHIETLSVWDWKDASKECNFEEARSLASDSWNRDHVDYFVDCHYSEVDDRMWVIGGTNAGTLGYFPVNYRGVGAIGSPEAILEGGHSAVVRTVLPVSSTHVHLTRNQGIFGWTGGEDGRLCCWLSDESSEANNSWISGSLVMKSERPNRKSRHHPY